MYVHTVPTVSPTYSFWRALIRLRFCASHVLFTLYLTMYCTCVNTYVLYKGHVIVFVSYRMYSTTFMRPQHSKGSSPVCGPRDYEMCET